MRYVILIQRFVKSNYDLIKECRVKDFISARIVHDPIVEKAVYP